MVSLISVSQSYALEKFKSPWILGEVWIPILVRTLINSQRKFLSCCFESHLVVSDDSSSRVRSLRDPTKKMSKSDNDPKSRIALTDEPEILLDKVKKAITDFQSEVTYEPDTRAGVSNLVTIHSLLSGKSHEDICRDAQGLDTGKLVKSIPCISLVLLIVIC